jgi:hypothetical protein
MLPPVLISPERLHVMQARLDRAKKGPWQASLEGRDHDSGDSCICTPEGPIDLAGASDDDIEWIAHARQDMEDLLAWVLQAQTSLMNQSSHVVPENWDSP